MTDLRKLCDGCGMHGCFIKAPTGMAPNGGCRCSRKATEAFKEAVPRLLDENAALRALLGDEGKHVYMCSGECCTCHAEWRSRVRAALAVKP